MKKTKFVEFKDKVDVALCLAHMGKTDGKMVFCQHRDDCQRNLILREHLVTDEDVVYTNACAVGCGIITTEAA